MEPLLYFAINLTIEVAKTMNCEAIDYLLSTLDCTLGDAEFEAYFDEVSSYLSTNHPEVLKWMLDYLDPEFEDDDEELEGSEPISTNADSERVRQETVKYLNKFVALPVNSDEVFQVYCEDLIHLLLDEGFNSKDYEVIDSKLYISEMARKFLASHYNLECLDSLLGEKKDA